jgi:NAD-dependent dihydropyrimidine dehydrogenase PreA subunit
MGVILNHKICDNAEECSGIVACPTGALYWDAENEKVAIDNEKCVDCDLCEKTCGVGALRVFHNEDEKIKIEEEIKNDSRKVSDLFVDKYGAMPMKNSPFDILYGFEQEILKANKTAVVEVFEDDSIECLLKSIPIKKLFVNRDIKFRKTEISDELKEKYQVKKLPCLLFFNKGKLIGKIEGFYGADKKEKLLEKIEEILK